MFDFLNFHQIRGYSWKHITFGILRYIRSSSHIVSTQSHMANISHLFVIWYLCNHTETTSQWRNQQLAWCVFSFPGTLFFLVITCLGMRMTKLFVFSKTSTVLLKSGHRWLISRTLNNECIYLSISRFKLNHVNKRGPWYFLSKVRFQSMQWYM